MTDELVQRLRGDWCGYEVSLKAIDAIEEAADRIEALTAELRVVKEDRDTYRAALVGAGFLPDRAAPKGERHE